MTCTVSRSVRIVDENVIFFQTVEIWQNALSDLIQVCDTLWPALEKETSLGRRNLVDRSIHATANRSKVVFPFFDKKYPNMPSEFRRCVASYAIGAVSAYKQAMKNWEKSDKTHKKPTLNLNRNQMPCFDKRTNFKFTEDGSCEIKLFVKGGWRFVKVKLNQSDMRYLQSHFDMSSASSPVLKKHGTRWSLVFVFSKIVVFEKKDEIDNLICAVDLGINHAAVCSIMRADGTILGRSFIDLKKEENRLMNILAHIRKAYSNGSRCPDRLLRYLDHYNTELATRTSSEIVKYALKMGADVIVMENLSNTHGKLHGSKKHRLSVWRKMEITKRTENLAHSNGLRFSTVCAWNTSRLAFDGSGEVVRHEDNMKLCTFPNGKVYACDLSASYNIGARYFIRALLSKASEATSAMPPETKAFLDGIRIPTSTLSTLITLNAMLGA